MSLRNISGVALVLAFVVLAWRSHYLDAMQANPTGALQSVGLGVFCLWTASRRQIALCLMAGLALRLLIPVEAPYYAGGLIALLGLSGFCGYCLLVYRVAAGERQLFRVLLPALIFLGLSVMLASLLRLATRWTTHRFDLQIYAMDSAVWDGAAAFFGKLLVTHAWILHMEEIVYAALPGVMILVFAFYTYQRNNLDVDLLALYLTMGILGFLLYFVVPVCGPIYAFGDAFPFSLPPARTAALSGSIFQSAPNAMPSLHFANALMLYLNSKPWRGLRIFTLIFMILTAIATLGSGEHYITDLVVAVPFTIALQCMFSTASQRVAGAGFCTVLVTVWFLAITRIPVGGMPHWLLWILTVCSLLSPMLLRSGK